MTKPGTFDQSLAVTFPGRSNTRKRRRYISEGKLQRAFEYIRANDTENISLADLARVVELTPHHFSLLFKKAVGLSPHQYLLLQRINRAKLYLQDEVLSIAQVSRLVGFRTQGHFTKVFRKVVGVTPSKFRERRVS